MANDHVTSRDRREVLKKIGGASSLGVAGMAGCLSSGGGDDGTSQLTFAISGNKESAHYKGAELLADTVKSKSDGELTLDVVCCQQAGGPPQITQSVESGTLDMGLSAVNNLAGLTSAWLFSQLPYLWKTHQDMYDFFNNADIVEEINEKAYEDLSNISVKAYWGSNGGSMRHVHYTSNTGAKVPSDNANKRLRVTESPIEQATINQWGLSPSPIAWSETVSAMKQGTVSGIHIHYWWLYNSSMYEQIEYTVETETQDSPAVVHANQNSLDRLTDGQKTALNEAISEVTPKQIESDLEQGQRAKDLIKENNPDIEIYQPTDEELSEWQSAASSVYDEWVGKEGVEENIVSEVLSYQDYQPPGVDI
jgi:TRAP-type C4-dicarboxylate transport system substrate-binding protein